jgi:DNA-binding MarR family transcriptional regulator
VTTPGDGELTGEEWGLWHAWKVAAETVRTRVAADITAATGLSDPDFAVLTRVADTGTGRMRQNLLGESMGYHRSRLSHHLTRMEERGLVAREPAPGGVDVVITDAGREAVREARPVHAAAVRRYLIGPLEDADRALFREQIERLGPAGPDGTRAGAAGHADVRLSAADGQRSR